MADRAGVSSTGGVVHQFALNSLDDSNHFTMHNAKGPVHEGDILTLLESGQDARRLE